MGENSSAPRQPTAEEVRVWAEKNMSYMARRNQALESVRKLSNTSLGGAKRSATKITKEKLKKYLENPLGNEKNLRDVSKYLYYRSQVYYRIIKYYANMFELDARTVIPKYDLVKENQKESMLNSYQQTLSLLDRMNLKSNLIRAITICFREDVYYGCKYLDDTGMYILTLDPDYCRIEGSYPTGDFGFAFNCSFFDRNEVLLEYWGEPFQSMYLTSKSSGEKWQPLPDENAVCLKFRYEDSDTIIPPLSGIMNSLLSLINMEDLQDVLDEQEIYKIVVARLKTLAGTNQPDDWAVDPDLVAAYIDLLGGQLPPYMGYAISPTDIDVLSFNKDGVSDTTKIESATREVLDTAGGCQILHSSAISGSTAFHAALRNDGLFATSTLLPQIEGWVNRILSYHISNPAKVKFFNTTSYLKDEFRKDLLEAAQYGLPTKLSSNTLHGFSELDTMSLNFLEEDILGLSKLFVPLQSTHTTSGNIKDKPLSDEGEETKEKEKNKM